METACIAAQSGAGADDPEALCRAGIAAYRRGAYAEAASCFACALDLAPGHRGARINLANALWSLGDYETAALHAGLAREAAPEAAEAWIITGAIRLDRGDAGGAAEAYGEAARLRPQHPGAQAGLAAAFLALREHAAAEHAAETALRLAPQHEHALFTLASAQLALRRPEEALAGFDRLIAAAPGHARARHNRANALIDLGRLDEAETGLLEALERDPGLKEAWATLGYLRTVQEDLSGAIAACDRAIALDPDFAPGQWNRGVALLLNGDFAGGFAAYEWRKRHPVFRHHFTPLPGRPWQGEPLAGLHLMVRAEQGYGDTIMLARFLPLLAAEAAALTLCCPPCLFPLFRHLGISLRELNDPPAADFSVDQMSLPHLLGIDAGNIPGAGGYLRADPARVAAISGLLPELQSPARPRIGLVWAGNPGHDNDHHRSLAPGALAPLLALGLTCISLQIGARRGEYPIPDAAPLIRDYGDTAAILQSLDAVVTVDTSVAHLAGALGVPCHVLMSKACDWRWRLGSERTAWYDSLTLHRQTRLDDWSAPIASVIRCLSG